MSTWKRPRSRKPRAALHSRCAFCDREIPADHEVFGLGAKARVEVNLENYKGEIIEMTVSSLNRKVPAVVTGVGSPAERAGYDLYFMTCSQTCATGLKTALEQDLGGNISPG